MTNFNKLIKELARTIYSMDTRERGQTNASRGVEAHIPRAAAPIVVYEGQGIFRNNLNTTVRHGNEAWLNQVPRSARGNKVKKVKLPA